MRIAVENYVNSVIGEQGQATIGAVTLSVDEEEDRPTLLLEEVQVTGLLHGRSVLVDEIEVVVEIRSLLSADIGPSRIAARGLTIGPSSAPAVQGPNPGGQLAGALASLSMALESMASSGPDRVSVTDIRMDDVLPGSGIDLVAGSLEAESIDDAVRFLASAGMVRDGMELGNAGVEGRHGIADGSTGLAATATILDAGMLGGILLAEGDGYSGEVGLSTRIEFDRTGQLVSTTGSISLGGGTVRLPGIDRPYAVGSASARFAYGQETGLPGSNRSRLRSRSGRSPFTFASRGSPWTVATQF